jgi:hypothetical protein
VPYFSRLRDCFKRYENRQELRNLSTFAVSFQSLRNYLRYCHIISAAAITFYALKYLAAYHL